MSVYSRSITAPRTRSASSAETIFGLIHVDYQTQRRTPKASARFYSDVIRTRGAALFQKS